MKARHAARGERRRRYRSRRDCTATARRCGRACAFAPAARGGRDLSAGGRARGNTTSTRHRDSPPRAPRRLGRRRALPQSRALVGVAGARSRPRPAARARTASAASCVPPRRLASPFRPAPAHAGACPRPGCPRRSPRPRWWSGPAPARARAPTSQALVRLQRLAFVARLSAPRFVHDETHDSRAGR